VQGVLGHTDIETTRRMYAPLQAGRQKQIAKLMDGRVTPERDTPKSHPRKT
jgi:integrase